MIPYPHTPTPEVNHLNCSNAQPDFYDLKVRVSRKVRISPDLKGRELVMGHPIHLLDNVAVYFPDSPVVKVRIENMEDGEDPFTWQSNKGDQDRALKLGQQLSKILGCQGDSLESTLCSWWSALLVCGNQKQRLIIPESLPSQDELIKWGGADITNMNVIFPRDIECSLAAFLHAYLQLHQSQGDLYVR